MRSNLLREQIRREVYFSSEAADYLNVSRQQINNIVKSGSLTPIKVSASGSLFLKEDLDVYANKKNIENLFMSKDIIGGGITRISKKFFFNEMKDYERITEVFVYFNVYDAINDGFYTTFEYPQRDVLMKIKAPTMVIRYDNMEEFWFDGFNAGYGGEGPHGTQEVLKELGVDPEYTKLVFSSQWVKYFKENDKWRVVYQSRQEAESGTGWQNNLELYAKIYSFNQNLVMIQDNYNKSWIEYEPENFLKAYFCFVPSPDNVTIYTREMAKQTGHYKCSTVDETYYQLVIKDRSGRELWINYFIDETISIKRQSSLMNILKALEIDISEEKRKGLPTFLKNLLGLNLMVNDYITLYK